MVKLKPCLVDFEYEHKDPFLSFADSIHRKTIYPLFHGRKIIFYKVNANELAFSQKAYKRKCITILFFAITMPLLCLTMVIKSLSIENKIKFRELNEIANRQKAKIELRKKVREDAHLKKILKRKQQLIAAKNLKAAKERIRASPRIESLSGKSSVRTSTSSSKSQTQEQEPVSKITAVQKHSQVPIKEAERENTKSKKYKDPNRSISPIMTQNNLVFKVKKLFHSNS